MFSVKLKKFLFLTASAALELGTAPFALAACDSGGGGLQNPLNACSFSALIESITRIVAQIGVPVAVFFIIYAGFLFVTARGSEDKLKTAKKTLLWTIIGVALILGAWAIARAIRSFIGTL